MGKTPKKAAPGGDERNSCVRRLKSTTASSKTSESEKQRESDYSNRPRLSNISKKVLPSSTKKNKLHNTANSLNQQLIKNLSKDTVKEGSVQNMLQHLRQVKQQKMQSKLEEAESTSSSISIEIDNKEETVNDVDNKKEETTTKDSNANHTTEEQDSTTNTNIEKKTAESIVEDTTTTTTTITTTTTATTSTNNETIQSQDKENEKKDHLEENNKKCDEQEQDEIQFHLRVDDSPAKSPDTTSTISIVNDENELDELPQIQVVSDEVKEKKSSQTESEAGTESCSVDIVESVTSELSEASEPPSQQDTTQKERENIDFNAKNEMLGINYDASVTLKDVQIKLNDCLKEKLKHVEVCESDDNNISNLSASNTFGKTLRNISGRTAIDRFRHSSSYDFLVSPNNSQSTNISMSQSPRRDTTNTKILRYSTGLSDVMSSNGSFVERKRKLADSPESTATLKKQKTEQSSLLNTSMDIIRGLRKPIQISTPNISYKEQSDKLNISEINDGNDKFLSMHTTEDGTKKWCVIM